MGLVIEIYLILTFEFLASRGTIYQSNYILIRHAESASQIHPESRVGRMGCGVHAECGAIRITKTGRCVCSAAARGLDSGSLNTKMRSPHTLHLTRASRGGKSGRIWRR